MSPYYFLFRIQYESCKKLEIQNDLPIKLPKVNLLFFLTNSGQKSLTMLISSFFNNSLIDLKKIEK